MKKSIIYVSIILSLSLIGLVMIYSSSMIWAQYKTGNEYYYLIRQSIFLGIGLIIFLISSKLNYKILYKYSNWIFILSIILIILVLIPGIGKERNGSRSWIGIGEFSVQPAEIMKIGFIIFTAKFLSNNEGIMKKNIYFYLYMIIVGLVFGLILLQPDFGSGMIMV